MNAHPLFLWWHIWRLPTCPSCGWRTLYWKDYDGIGEFRYQVCRRCQWNFLDSYAHAMEAAIVNGHSPESVGFGLGPHHNPDILQRVARIALHEWEGFVDGEYQGCSFYRTKKRRIERYRRVAGITEPKGTFQAVPPPDRPRG